MHCVPSRRRWKCLLENSVRVVKTGTGGGAMWRQMERQTTNEVLYSPPLISHAPYLSHTALLPHFNHACEGLHTRLPLGDKRHLPLHTHIGPGTKTVIKILKVSKCSSGIYRHTDGSGAIYDCCKKCCSHDRRTNFHEVFFYLPAT